MLSHVDQNLRPTMVDVGSKEATHRSATARSLVMLPPVVAAQLVDGEIRSKKGPVFATAIIAGTMAAKKCWDLIPFCHPLPIDSCKIDIECLQPQKLAITATVKTFHKTGVEMEALTAASVAALTIYDMCKALSHDIIIEGTQLVAKTGGKQNVQKA